MPRFKTLTYHAAFETATSFNPSVNIKTRCALEHLSSV
jgi:hypothetical protein